MTMITCNVREATHVEINNQIKKILFKYGITEGTGVLLKPSKGGFGVITEDNQTITMWEAQRYFKEETNDNGSR
jgi:hypothetical protein